LESPLLPSPHEIVAGYSSDLQTRVLRRIVFKDVAGRYVIDKISVFLDIAGRQLGGYAEPGFYSNRYWFGLPTQVAGKSLRIIEFISVRRHYWPPRIMVG
jgi:hypothetical protein